MFLIDKYFRIKSLILRRTLLSLLTLCSAQFENLFFKISNLSGTCDKLPEYLDPSLSVTETFSVATGTVLDVTLSCTNNKLAVGDKTITCFGGSHFFYSKTPACLPQGMLLINRQK